MSNKRAADNGVACWPIPSDVANIFGAWGPRSEPIGTSGVPVSGAFTLTPRSIAPNRDSLLELSDTASVNFLKVYGPNRTHRGNEGREFPESLSGGNCDEIPYFIDGHTPTGDKRSQIFAENPRPCVEFTSDRTYQFSLGRFLQRSRSGQLRRHRTCQFGRLAPIGL